VRNNLLLATLVKFAWSIRDQRRDPAAIREKLLQFIFTITPADHAAVLPFAQKSFRATPLSLAIAEDAANPS
jgi:hypothetical protein